MLDYHCEFIRELKMIKCPKCDFFYHGHHSPLIFSYTCHFASESAYDSVYDLLLKESVLQA
jgi:hypothetical protein